MTFPNESNLPELEKNLAITSAGVLTAGVFPNGHGYFTGLFGAGTAPTIAVVTAGSGSGSSIGSQLGFDMAGSFVITTAGSPAAGALATVTFGTALSAVPAAILLNCFDTTASPNVGLAVGPTSIATTGFKVSGPAATTAHTLLVNYVVFLQEQ